MAGGKISQLIRMLKQLPDEQSDALLKRLLQEQPLVALRIIQEHFSFEDLQYASEAGIRELVDSVSIDVLVTSLNGASDPLIRTFASGFGTHQARTFIEDVDASHAGLQAIDAARRKILVKAMMMHRRSRLGLKRPGIEA